MTRLRFAGSTLLALGVVACTAPQDRDPIRMPYRAGQGKWGERTIFDVYALPGVWIRPDVDQALIPGLTNERAEGEGIGTRIGIGNRDQSVGLLFHGADLEGVDTQERLQTYALFADFDVTIPLVDEPDGFAVHAAAGFGAARMEFERPEFDDRTTGAANLRMDLEYAFTRRFALEAGLGGLMFGRPGDTEGYGTFLEFGVRVSF